MKKETYRMVEYIREHRVLIVIGILVMGFLVFAFQQKPQDNSSAISSFKEVDMASPMSRGGKDAPVSIIQYSDFLCPSCSYFSTQIMPGIDKTYITTNKVNFEFRPMAFIADGSLQAGMGGYCAIDQNKFWPYHDAIYSFVAQKVFNENKDPKTDIILTARLVKDIASQSGLSTKEFDSCMDSNKHKQTITEATQTANRNGITGTPYLMVNGQHYQGAISPTAFEAFIKAKL